MAADAAEEQRVAVGRRARRGLRADDAARARPVVDDHRLPELRGESLPDQPRDGVVAAAGGERHDQAQRFVGKRRVGRQRKGNEQQQRQRTRTVLHRTLLATAA